MSKHLVSRGWLCFLTARIWSSASHLVGCHDGLSPFLIPRAKSTPPPLSGFSSGLWSQQQVINTVLLCGPPPPFHSPCAWNTLSASSPNTPPPQPDSALKLAAPPASPAQHCSEFRCFFYLTHFPINIWPSLQTVTPRKCSLAWQPLLAPTQEVQKYCLLCLILSLCVFPEGGSRPFPSTALSSINIWRV